VNVDPTDAAAIQVPGTNELHHLSVTDGAGLMDPRIGGQKLSSSAAVTDKQFSINQVVPGYFIMG
jgi:hypothetical protein